jgi:hypothetical protein
MNLAIKNGILFRNEYRRIMQCCEAGASRGNIIWLKPEPLQDAAPAPTAPVRQMVLLTKVKN